MYPNEKIKGAMAEQGLTVDDVAREAGLSTTTVSSIRNGKETVMLPTLKSVAGVLGFNVEIRFIPRTETQATEVAQV
jgi:transcriptional regulator with XRE-family HTH domain